MKGLSNNCILHCALHLNLGSLGCAEIFSMELFPQLLQREGQDKTRGSAQPPPPPQVSTDMDHNLLVQARRVSLNLERAGTPCQSSLPGSSAVHRGFAQRVRSATCAQRLLSLTPRSRVRRYIDVPPARTVGQLVNSYASEPYLCMLHFAYITHHQKVWNMLTSGSPFAAYSAPAFAISVKRSAQQ